MKITIVKIGGNVLENPEFLASFIQSFKSISGLKWLVHGGGNRATQLAERLGVESTFMDGRRVTSEAFLDIAIDTYSGVNKRLVAILQQNGIQSIGLSGADLNVIPSKKRFPEPIDFGCVGDPTEEPLHTPFLDFLLNESITPVFSALSFDEELGSLLNTNADSIAGVLAAKLSGIVDVELILAFEKAGVLRDVNDSSSLIEHLNKDEVEYLKLNGVIADGMIPKVTNAIQSLENGVSKVRITAFDALDSGTVIQLS